MKSTSGHALAENLSYNATNENAANDTPTNIRSGDAFTDTQEQSRNNTDTTPTPSAHQPTTDPTLQDLNQSKFLLMQVAHDLRSPLSTLKFVSKNFPKGHEPMEEMYNAAILRIQGLLNRISNSQQTSLNLKQNTPIRKALLNIVAEKRAEYSDKSPLRIDFIDKTSQDINLQMDAAEFAIMLSNLINNSVEADANFVEVILSHDEFTNQIEIEVYDNGNGIAPYVIERLGEKGFSHNKKSGSGLGLYHAKSLMESMGAEFSIGSELRAGTVVKLRFDVGE